MRSQKGFTLVEALLAIAVLGIIAAVVILNLNNFVPFTPVEDEAWCYYSELRQQPISSLNITELQFVVDYAVDKGSTIAAAIYQNQIIILKLEECSQESADED